MSPRKKDRVEIPEIVTTPVEDEAGICSAAGDGACAKASVGDSPCPNSKVSEDMESTSC